MGEVYETIWLSNQLMGEIMKSSVDNVSKILTCCQKREEILLNGQSMSRYNHYLDKMRKLARELFDENRQDELLPYLKSESVSVREDVACLLYHFYPDLCGKIIREIADMKVVSGLPKHLAIVAVTASFNMKNGIPEDFP